MMNKYDIIKTINFKHQFISLFILIWPNHAFIFWTAGTWTGGIWTAETGAGGTSTCLPFYITIIWSCGNFDL